MPICGVLKTDTMNTSRKILAGITALIIIRKAAQHPKQAVYVLKFFVIFFIAIVLFSLGLQLKEYIDNPPIKQEPGESIQHFQTRLWNKDLGMKREFYEYKNNP